MERHYKNPKRQNELTKLRMRRYRLRLKEKSEGVNINEQ